MFSLDQYRALHSGAGLFPREDRGRISLRGTDRKPYLQGLLSNDILALEPGGWCYATMLTAQGRMISDMRVFELADMILIDLERPVTDAVRLHLDNFVITEDVVVADVTATFAQIGLYGPQAAAILDAVVAADPSATPAYVLEGTDIGIAGFDLIAPQEAAATLTSALERAGAIPIDAATAEVTRVEAGIPRFLVDMDGSTIPLEAGIEDRAISLTKGCYVGQEVIIRVLHRGGGRVAKKLVGLVGEAGGMERDDRVFAAERDVGRVTSAVSSPRVGKRIALAYVHRDFSEPGTPLRVRTSAGDTAAIVVALPFAG